jgi:hypothetical protein
VDGDDACCDTRGASSGGSRDELDDADESDTWGGDAARVDAHNPNDTRDPSRSASAGDASADQPDTRSPDAARVDADTTSGDARVSLGTCPDACGTGSTRACCASRAACPDTGGLACPNPSRHNGDNAGGWSAAARRPWLRPCPIGRSDNAGG